MTYHHTMVCWLWLFTSWQQVISGLLLTCDSVHSWWLHSVALLGNQAIGTMTRFPTQSHYPDTEVTSPILLILSARLESDKSQFYKSLVWLDQEPNSWSSATRGPRSSDSATAPDSQPSSMSQRVSGGVIINVVGVMKMENGIYIYCIPDQCANHYTI